MKRVIYYSVIPDGTWLTIRVYEVKKPFKYATSYLETLEKTRKQVGLKPYRKVAIDYLSETYPDCQYKNID